MEVKGSFFFGRRRLIVERFGQAKWDQFIERFSKTAPAFSNGMLVTTLVPVETYCQFEEALVREFFGGRQEAHWEIGEASAEWAMTEGPYRTFRQNAKELKAFVERTLPAIYSTYFTAGKMRAACWEDVVDIQIVDLPRLPICLEYVSMGFNKRSIELMGFEVTAERLKGFSLGHSLIHYLLRVRRR